MHHDSSPSVSSTSKRVPSIHKICLRQRWDSPSSAHLQLCLAQGDRQLVKRLHYEGDALWNASPDVHDVATLLHQHIAQLDEPLLTYELYEEFVEVTGQP